MITTTPLSKSVLKTVFEKTDIYHCNSFEPKWSLTAYGSDYNTVLSSIRYEYLYSCDGFVTSINNYSTEPSRIFEFLKHGDQPLTIRHKLNMVDTLIDTDMKTNLPTHISIEPKFKDKKVDIQDLYHNPTDYKMIIHPGFTRMNGAIFLNSPLRNVLIYINKEHNVQLNNHQSLTKINSEQELVKNYIPFTDLKNYEIDFYIPNKFPEIDKWTFDGIKHHNGTKTPVLKSNGIKIKPFKEGCSVHPSDNYALSTFITFDKFCNILFNNKIKVYIEKNTKDKLAGQFSSNIEKISLGYFGNPNTIRTKIVSQNSNREHYMQLKNLKRLKNISKQKSEFYDQFIEPLRKFHEEQTEESSPSYYINHLEHWYIEKAEELDEKNFELRNDKGYLSQLVKDNNFKGIIAILNKDCIKRDRTFSEIIMCLSPTSAVTRSEDSSIILINCNHQFWSTGINYIEKTINKQFFMI